MQFKWLDITTSHLHLNEDEWKEMITTHLDKIQSKPVGKLLLDRLNHYIKIGYTLEFTNAMSDSCIYPKTIFKNPIHITVVIPNVPYFVSVHTWAHNKRFSEMMPWSIIVAHELIHCLRFFEGMVEETDDEDATIHGYFSSIHKNVLKINDTVITENAIRSEHGLNQRTSHSSKELYCYKVMNSYKNASKFDKEHFFT
jgi:hypothetical protein